jgi:hypothetical protein
MTRLGLVSAEKANWANKDPRLNPDGLLEVGRYSSLPVQTLQDPDLAAVLACLKY